MALSDILYLKLSKSTEVDVKAVTLGDVAKMECTNNTIVNKLKTIKILQIPNDRDTRFVISVMKVIELIHKEYPSLEINNIGEIDFVVELKSDKDKRNPWEWIKVAFVCFIVFFGSAFAIMTFNVDASVDKLFGSIYEQIMGSESSGFTIIEIMYAVGILTGIVVFYNHFGRKKITRDPTPIEVEMRTYEKEINDTLIEGVNRRSEHIDVD